jgi:hypothetical protein
MKFSKGQDYFFHCPYLLVYKFFLTNIKISFKSKEDIFFTYPYLICQSDINFFSLIIKCNLVDRCLINYSMISASN